MDSGTGKLTRMDGFHKSSFFTLRSLCRVSRGDRLRVSISAFDE